jgi:hypothetical protein
MSPLLAQSGQSNRARVRPLSDNSGQRLILDCGGLSAYDPKLDSGPGIENRRLAAIFEPFVTTKPKGTGLGLPICSRIIERHGGQLKASPDCNHGALGIQKFPFTGGSVG